MPNEIGAMKEAEKEKELFTMEKHDMTMSCYNCTHKIVCTKRLDIGNVLSRLVYNSDDYNQMYVNITSMCNEFDRRDIVTEHGTYAFLLVINNEVKSVYISDNKDIDVAEAEAQNILNKLIFIEYAKMQSATVDTSTAYATLEDYRKTINTVVKVVKVVKVVENVQFGGN